MQPDSLTTQQSLQLVVSAHEFFHEFRDMAWAMFGALILKDYIVEVIGGLFWRFRSPYKKYDIVQIDGEWARINYMGWMKTEFNVFTFSKSDPKKINGGSIRQILNVELRRMKIQKPLALVDVAEELRDAFH